MEINGKKLSPKEQLLKEIEILKSYKGLAKKAAEAKVVELEKKLSELGFAVEVKAAAPQQQKQSGQAVADPILATQVKGEQAVADPEKASKPEGEQAVVDPVSKKKTIIATPSKKKK
jgi:hypothetical protein